jgi:hypothetical protein
MILYVMEIYLHHLRGHHHHYEGCQACDRLYSSC